MEDGDISETLQQVTMQRIVYNDSRCYDLISNDSIQFCAVGNGEGKGNRIILSIHPPFIFSGVCGGALMMFTATHQWTIVGIVSYGYGCANPYYASVFMRMVHYVDWIHLMQSPCKSLLKQLK